MDENLVEPETTQLTETELAAQIGALLKRHNDLLEACLRQEIMIDQLQMANAILEGRAQAAEGNFADADKAMHRLCDRLTGAIDRARPRAPTAPSRDWPEDETTTERLSEGSA